MNAIKVDETHRLRLPMLSAGDYYLPAEIGNSVLLYKVPKPHSQMTEAEALAALEESPIKFKSTWQQLREEIR